MILALDADILQYEVAFAAEAYWKYLHKERGEEVTNPPPFDIAADMLDARVEEIVEKAGCENVQLFFTGKNNYRHHIAKTQPYKDRESQRPFHYKNVKAYLQSRYEWEQRDWFEADDLLKLVMIRNPGDYTCGSRDKDLHQIPGRHYGWEIGKQPEFGPMEISELGFLKMGEGKTKKLIGGGEKFFYAQMLLGDPVDNIPGIDGMGPVSTLALLSPIEDVTELQAVVFGVYSQKYGVDAVDRFIETGNLLRMAEEANEDWTKVKLWNPFSQDDQWMNVRTGEVSDSPV